MTVRVDDENSSTTPLDAGNTFTGTWADATGHGTHSITVSCSTDAGIAGQVSLQFSQDASTVSGTAGPWPFASSGSIGVPKAAIPTARYYRVKVENTSGSNQTELNLQTIVGTGARIALPTSRVAQSQTDYSDCLNVFLARPSMRPMPPSDRFRQRPTCGCLQWVRPAERR